MSIYVVTGSDEGRVAEEAAALFEELKPPGSDEFVNEIIEGVADNAEHAFQKAALAVEALQTIGFFGGDKVVWLKSVNFLGTDRTSEAERAVSGAENLLETLQAGLPPGVDFLLSCSALNGVRRIGKWLKANADFRSFDKVDISKEGWEEQVAIKVKRLAKSKGLSFLDDALELFVQRAGAESRQIANEIEKLDLYLGKDRREVTEEDVTLLVSVSHKGVIWEISRAIERRDANRAISLIDSLLLKNESAVGLIKASIIPTVRNLFFAKLAEPYGSLNRAPKGIIAALPKKKDGTINTWGLKNAGAAARKFSLDHLRLGLEHCLKADKALVTSSQDPRMVLHQLVIRLCEGKRAA